MELNEVIDKSSHNQVIQDIEIEDPRITVVYYYSDPKDSSVDQFINPEIIDKTTIGILDESEVTKIEKITDEEILKFKQAGYFFAEVLYKSLTTSNCKLLLAIDSPGSGKFIS